MPIDTQQNGISSPFISALGAQTQDLIQTRTWERMFHDALFPALLYRMDVTPDEFVGQLGARMAMTRTGLIPISTTPQLPNSDPPSSTYPSEQWEVVAAQYANSIDTDTMVSSFALANQFIENIQKLGLNAGQTMNHLARNQLYIGYQGGQTLADTNGVTNTVHVLQLAGFLTNVNVTGGGAIPYPVSATNPIAAVARAGTVNAENVLIIAATPDDANNPYGPGTLTFSANPATGIVSGDAIVAITSSQRVRVGGGYSDDAITGTDTPTFANFMTAVAMMRQNNIPAHSDGYFHVHVAPTAETVLFQDTNFQRALTALPDSPYWRRLAIGQMAGVVFMRDTEVPSLWSIQPTELFPYEGATSATGAAPNTPLYRSIVTGHGVMYEKYVKEQQAYITEAGITGKVGEFTITNNGISVNVDRVRLTLRAPLDKKQQVVTATWSWTGDFPVPSDVTTPYVGANLIQNINARYERAVVLIHA